MHDVVGFDGGKPLEGRGLSFLRKLPNDCTGHLIREFAGNEQSPSGWGDPIFHSEMTKKNKAAKAAAAAAAQYLISSTKGSSNAGAANGAKKKKKKKGGFASFLSGAAKVAAELAPAVLPMLLASHGPTRAAGLAAGPQTSQMVGLAEPASLQPMTGLTNIQPIISGGKVVGITLTGMDYLGSVNSDGSVATGEVMATIDLSIRSADWAGTRLQRESTLYERFAFQHLCVMYEPTAPATTPGQLVAYIDTDAAETFTESGRSAVQVATAHVGAEMFQVWQMGMALYCPDNATQDYYADAEGSDVRLTSPGKYRILAATDISGEAGALGNLYACYQVALKVPQLEESVGEGAAVIWRATANGSLGAAFPFGSDPADVEADSPNTLENAYWFLPAGDDEICLTDFPPGFYWVFFGCPAATAVATPTIAASGSNISVSIQWTLSATTIAFSMYTMTVQDDAVAETDYIGFSFGTLTAPITTYPVVYIIRAPAALAASTRRMTLQDYEKMTRDFQGRIATLEMLAAAAGAPASAAAPVLPSERLNLRAAPVTKR